MSVSDSKQSWETCFDDMPGKTKPFPVPQRKLIQKNATLYFSCSATLTHSNLPIHFCRSYKFRGGSTSPISSANSAQLGAETASL